MELELRLSGQRRFRVRLADPAPRRSSRPVSRGCSRSTTRSWCPVNKIVRVQVTGVDVIHAFSVPSFGVKIDAIPGRLNETWFKVDQGGLVLRPVLRAVRQGSRLHADRGPGRQRAGVHHLDRGGEEEVRERRRHADHRREPPAFRPSNTARRTQRPTPPQRTSETEPKEPRQWIPTRPRTAPMTPTMAIRTDGGASSIRPITRTSARCTWCSPYSPA